MSKSPSYSELWLSFKARWNGTDKHVDSEADKKLTNFIVKYSRLCTLAILFQSSLFTACTSELRTAEDNSETTTLYRRRKSVQANCYLDKLAQSSQLKRAFASHSFAINSIYLMWLAMSLMSILLDLSALEQYRYLDCLILGRFNLNARISQATKYVCFVILIFHLTFRFITIAARPTIRLHMLDFLHRDLDSVERCDWSCESIHDKMFAHNQGKRKRQATLLNAGQAKSSFSVYYIKYVRNTPSSSSATSQMNTGQAGGDVDIYREDEVMFAKTTHLMKQFNIRKLNRHSRHWFRFNVLMLAWSLIAIIYLIPFCTYMLSLMTPTIVTKRGFELSYPNCVSFIRSHATGSETNSRALEYKYIYDATTEWRNSIEMSDSSSSTNSSNRSKIKKKKGALREGPVWLPLENFATGHYHSFRMAFDYLAGMGLFLDGMTFILSHAILHILIGYDILLNSGKLRKRLVSLRESRWRQAALDQLVVGGGKLNQANSDFSFNRVPSIKINEACRYGNKSSLVAVGRLRDHAARQSNDGRETMLLSSYRASSSCKRAKSLFDERAQASEFPPGLPVIATNQCEKTATTHETIVLQTLLLDHFKSTVKYNHYVSKIILFYVCYWLVVTCIILFWLGITASEAIHYEFYVVELTFTLILLAYLLLLSIIRTSNHAFYPLITSLMAMDIGHTSTKLRWLSILDCFQPKPMYCFTLISKEISHLFVVRVIAWTFSALFVVVSFFYERLARMKLMGGA